MKFKFRRITDTFPLKFSILLGTTTAQKMKFAINDFSSKCNQIRRNLWIWSHLMKKLLMENFWKFLCSVRPFSTSQKNLYSQIIFGSCWPELIHSA